MNTFLSSQGYSLYKKDLTNEQINKIKTELSVTPFVPLDFDFIPISSFKLYSETENKIYLPKSYGLKNFGVPSIDRTPNGKKINLEFVGNLRDEQIKPVESFIESCYNPLKRGGVLNLRCAFGKTTLALYIITKLSVKTLIVVHKDFLLQQWKERIEQFIPKARIGLIKAKIFDIEDKDIVLASLQSLSMKTYDKSLFDCFGFSCFDECLPYNQSINTVNGPIKIGLLYNMWQKKEILPKVLSYNLTTQKMEYKNITYAWKKINPNLLELCFGKIKLKCTYNHKILTNNGFKEAQNINIGDLVIFNNNNDTSETISVKNINKITNYTNNVYDIEVEDNHNFIACGKSGIGPVVHNCHHTSVEVFSKALKKFSTKYTLGLSATIKRKDGLSKVFLWYLGDVVFSNCKTKDNDEVQILYKKFYDASPYYSKEQYMMGTKLNISKMINNITEFKKRTDFIVNEINLILNDEPSRKLIILSDRKSLLIDLFNHLNINYKCGYYLGGMKQDELKKSEEAQILLATFSMASEGFDVKSLDTLVLATPKSDVVQSVGRILRELPENRKNIPLVLDIVDDFSLFSKQAEKRLKYYKKCSYNIDGDIENNKEKHKLITLTGCQIKNLE